VNLTDFYTENVNLMLEKLLKCKSAEMVRNVVSYETALQTVFNGRVNIRKETMELEVSERILALKIHKKELTLNRLNQLVDDTDHCKVVILVVVVVLVVGVVVVVDVVVVVVVFKPFFCFTNYYARKLKAMWAVLLLLYITFIRG